MKKVILRIEGMSCSACSSGLEKYLNKQEGILNASVNLVLAQAMIEYENALELGRIEEFVKEAGFKSLGLYENNFEEKKNQKEKRNIILFSLLTIFLLYISMGHMIGLPEISLLDKIKHPTFYALFLFLITIPFLFYGRDIIKSGYKNLVHKTPNMDTLVMVGVFSSLLYSIFSTIMVIRGDLKYLDSLYFESVAMVIFFIKLGRILDSKSKEKTKEAIKELVTITPNTALLKLDNEEKEVTIDEVKIGDILIGKPGMKIAVDGIIIKGETHLEEAFITGESKPSFKKVGDKVIAGSMNIEGYIEYEAKKIGKDSMISEIVRMVVEASNTKAPLAKIADQVSSYFVPAIMLIAFFTLIGYLVLGYGISEGILSFVTVLVVACPCALGLATPLAMVVSIGFCAKNGILVKNSEILENAHKIDTIVFDKTGTLTYGNLKIAKVINDSNYSEEELLALVSSLESKSTHPISKAFLNYAKEKKLSLKEVSSFENIPGMGLKGIIDQKEFYIGNQKLLTKLKIENNYEKKEETLSKLGNSIVYVVEEKNIIALIGVDDIVREDAKKAVSLLQKLGKQVIMLTGDNEKTAHIIAKEVGIKEVIANVMPKDKTEEIKKLIHQKKIVMMVGDGINDAPSLVTANIGVSIASSTDIALDSSDVILIHNNLESIISLLSISEKTVKNMKENLFWAFFYNICMIPVAIGFLKPLGIRMSPMIAGLAMTLSSLTVVINTLRLRKIKKEKNYVS